MSVSRPEATANRLLALLPSDEAQRLAGRMDFVPLEARQVLCEPKAPIEHAYFPCAGVVSWLASTEEGSGVEVATIGNEGMVGSRILLGGDTMPAKVIVQVPGSAFRIRSADLRAELHGERPLVGILHRYLNAFLTQIMQSAACNALHNVEQRFCRWLLMTQDRVHANQFQMGATVLSTCDLGH